VGHRKAKAAFYKGAAFLLRSKFEVAQAIPMPKNWLHLIPSVFFKSATNTQKYGTIFGAKGPSVN
jgi:hypothetical protein